MSLLAPRDCVEYYATYMKHKRNTLGVIGFTIIELLIVVVVIGILALIALNAFGGVQERANNTLTISNTSNYYDALVAYGVDQGEYPFSSGSFCLGIGYDDITGSAAGDCFWSNDLAWAVAENSSVMDQLRPYIGSTDFVNKEEAGWSTTTGVGAYAFYSDSFSVNGDASRSHYIRYILDGAEEDCGLSALAPNGWPAFLTANPNPYTYSSNASNSTLCFVALPEIE